MLFSPATSDLRHYWCLFFVYISLFLCIFTNLRNYKTIFAYIRLFLRNFTNHRNYRINFA